MNPAPGSCGIAFKEWASVCAALLVGRQTIILRKGGISEGSAPGVFVPEHTEFWLYPTWVHQAEQGVRDGSALGCTASAIPRDGSVTIQALIRVDFVSYVESQQLLPALEQHHILTAETVLKRFHYRNPGLWVLGARVSRQEPGFEIPKTAEHAGCKTWVELEEPLRTSGVIPVLDDESWGRAPSSASRNPGGREHSFGIVGLQVGMPEPIKKTVRQSRSVSPRSRTSTGFKPARPSHGVSSQCGMNWGSRPSANALRSRFI